MAGSSLHLRLLHAVNNAMLQHKTAMVHYNILYAPTASVRFVGVFGGLTPPLVEDGDCKVWSESDPLRKVKNPNSWLNRYKLMSDIIPIHKNSFCNGL